MANTCFNFIPRAWRPEKPRKFGITEIRGPHYWAYGTRHMQDVFDVAGPWIDGIKWAGGSFALLPQEQVKAINKIAHDHQAYVSSGGLDRDGAALWQRRCGQIPRRSQGSRLRRDRDLDRLHHDADDGP